MKAKTVETAETAETAKKAKTPKEMTDKELCAAYKAMDEHVCNDDVSHSFAYEYSMLTEMSNEMMKRGIQEEGTNNFIDKNGNEIE